MTQIAGAGQPVPVQGVTGGQGLSQGSASIDPDTGNIVFTSGGNVTQFRKGSTPQSIQVYERFGASNSYERIAINTQTNGPFQLAVEVAPAGTLRDLQIISPRNVTISATALTVTGTTALQANVVAFSLQSNNSIAPGYQNGIGSAIFSFAGVPSAAVGANGDFYFRTDGAALTTIYQKRAGAWVGIV